MGVWGLVAGGAGKAGETGGNRNGRWGTPWDRGLEIQGKNDGGEKEERIPGGKGFSI